MLRTHAMGQAWPSNDNLTHIDHTTLVICLVTAIHMSDIHIDVAVIISTVVGSVAIVVIIGVIHSRGGVDKDMMTSHKR